MLIKSTRTSQPAGAVGIDWANPITRGLCTLYSPTGDSYNLVFSPSLNTIVGNSKNEFGKSVTATGSVSPSPSQTEMLAPVTSSEWTLFSLVKDDGPTSPAGSFYAAWGLHNSGSDRIHLSLKQWPTNSFGGDYRPYLADVTTPVSVGYGKRALSVTISSSSIYHYLDGSRVSTNTPSSSAAVTLRFLEVFSKAGGDITPSGSQNSLMVAWSRALSDSEIKSLSANPWQIFKPVSRTIPITATSVALTIVQPTGEISAGTWTPSSGSDLWATVDEPTPSDADYISTAAAGTTELALPAFVYPVGSNVVLSVRGSSTTGATLTVSLKQGGSIITGCTWTQVLTGTDTTHTFTLDAGQRAAITDPTVNPVSITVGAA